MDPTKQREYLKKKKQKKQQRFKEIEEEREQEKNKWLAFANKVDQFNALCTHFIGRTFIYMCAILKI